MRDGDSKMILDSPIKYDTVTELEFCTYLDDIKARLKKDAPEWHINKHIIPPLTMYHLSRWDFSKGKDQTWPINMEGFIFAYEETDKYYLLNKYPITEKE